MSLSYRSFLRNLPIQSALLREFLEKRAFDPGAEFDWETEEVKVARRLADRIAGYEPARVRDQVIADLGRVAQLADEAGDRQMRTVCGDQPTFTETFALLESPEERALWLHEHHPDKFDEAVEARFFDDRAGAASTTRHDLKVKRSVDRSAEARAALEAAIAAFYRKRHGSGQGCEVEIIDRHLEGTVQVTVYVQDLSNHRAEFDEGRLRRRRSFPAIESAINYHPTTGVADTVAKGGAEFHAHLAAAFAEFLLHTRIDPERIRPRTYKLENLIHGVKLVDPASRGLECVRLKSITVIDFATGLMIPFIGIGRGNRQSVEAQIAKAFPQENPLHRNMLVVAAQISLHFFPVAGEPRRRTLVLKFGRNGQSNLDKLEEKDRRLVEPLMVEWGLVDAPPPLTPSDPERDFANDDRFREAA